MYKPWKWYVYIIECKDGTYYTGMTWKPELRFDQHLSGLGGRYTALHGVKSLVYLEEHTDIQDARKREQQIKNWSQKKKAVKVLDKLPLDEICGIGPRIRNRLYKIGIFTFKQLRAVPLEILLFEFKSYGYFLYDAARGEDFWPVVPFFQKEEVKSIGHRHTLNHDTNNIDQLKQLFLKLTELIARRLRAKKLAGKTIHVWYRNAFVPNQELYFSGDSKQSTIPYTCDGLEIFKGVWKTFQQIWYQQEVRMVGASVSNLKPQNPQNVTFLPEVKRTEDIIQALDKINDKYGEFTLQRGIMLGGTKMVRKPNPYLSDRRFKI